jgi:hypothetical protein
MDLTLLPWWFWAILLLSIFGLIWFWKGTSMRAGNLRNLSIFGIVFILIVGFVAYPVAFALDDGDQQTVTGVDITTRYNVDTAVDSTTAVISADFSQTDEVGSGEYTQDNDKNTLTVANTCTYGTACTWDAFSFTFPIEREDDSVWNQGARVTSSVSASIDADILTWGVASNNTGGSPIIQFVDLDPLGKSGLVWTDGAGNNKGLGQTSVGSLNEFSPGEAVTSAGLYFAVNEDQMIANVPTGIFGQSFTITFSDDFGWSEVWTMTIQLTLA